ncbi:MAG: hypothetical protein MAGBODY4_01460 [Candidatus Marinimicrobia bacterium]|nr:hypothetical protein [Candidatus Neomarinimicrobiota bacterium]
MKYISYQREGLHSIGIWHDDRIFDIPGAARSFGNTKMPNDMLDFLQDFEYNHRLVTEMFEQSSPTTRPELFFPDGQAEILAPVPFPRSLRDFYAFENHVKTARANRGLDMIDEWYDIPVFYFSNHQAVYGPNTEIPYPQSSEALDFELEIAAIIGRKGRDISAEDAEEYIAGYAIMNDWSARDVQREEMQVGLGPAKGKDFATSLGPYLVTQEELSTAEDGENYNITMTATVNGEQYSSGNWNTLYHSFARMIERASADCTLYPGDVIGSGTVGTGCILELGADEYGWLQPGDTVSLAIERLGTLTNTIGAKKG